MPKLGAGGKEDDSETITSYDDTFDTFIEVPGTYMGTTYEVLYGSFRWGFTFTATDVPEPQPGR